MNIIHRGFNTNKLSDISTTNKTTINKTTINKTTINKTNTNLSMTERLQTQAQAKTPNTKRYLRISLPLRPECENKRIELIKKIYTQKKTQRIVFDYTELLREIQKGYHCISDIWKQFKIDLPRMKVNINGCNTSDPMWVVDYLHAQYPIEQAATLMMLCTQTVMAIPYEVLSIISNYSSINCNFNNKYDNTYINNSEDIYLGEISAIDNIDSDCHLSLIIQEQGGIKFRFQKKLRYFTVDTRDHTLVIIKITLEKIDNNVLMTISPVTHKRSIGVQVI